MMRTFMLVAGLAVAALPLAAQVRQDPERLREQVVQRFMENYRVQAGLTGDQFSRLQTSVRRHWEARRALEQRQRDIVEALGAQLRPGVAADADSVTRLLDGLDALHGDRAAALRQEQAEFREFLTPVQRAQLVLSFARLERQIEEIVRQRMEGMRQQRR